METSINETIIKHISVHGQSCIGCERHEKDVMITFMDEEKENVHDLFLTTSQADGLLNELKRVLESNDLNSLVSPQIIQLLITPNDATWQGRLLGLGSDGATYEAGTSGRWEPIIPPLTED